MPRCCSIPPQSRDRRTLRRAAWTAAVLTLAIAGCNGLSHIAPPIDQTMLTSGHSARALELGRDIYLVQCSRCHVAEPVYDYTANEWTAILPDMCDEAKLNNEETQAVTAYIDACFHADKPQ